MKRYKFKVESVTEWHFGFFLFFALRRFLSNVNLQPRFFFERLHNYFPFERKCIKSNDISISDSFYLPTTLTITQMMSSFDVIYNIQALDSKESIKRVSKDEATTSKQFSRGANIYEEVENK